MCYDDIGFSTPKKQKKSKKMYQLYAMLLCKVGHACPSGGSNINR